MKIIQTLIATVTRKPRQIVEVGTDFEWSSKSWTHNFFRTYELIFGRRVGIKAEMSAFSDGKNVTYYCHSWESVFALAEQYVRGWFDYRLPVRVWVPMMATPEGFVLPASPFLFAIALDTAAGEVSAPNSPNTFAYTCTGSNLSLFVGFSTGVSTPGVTAATYNLATMSRIGTGTFQASAGSADMYYLIGPSTGSNTISIIYTGGGASVLSAVSYSGTSQSAQPDSSNVGTATGATSLSLSTTVVASNCWTMMYCVAGAGTPAAGTGTTLRVGNATGMFIGDSNATVATGSRSLQATGSNTGWAGIIISIAPAGAAPSANSGFFMAAAA